MESEAAQPAERETVSDGEPAAATENTGGDEAFARRMGWRPETEWSGPENRKPARFLDAGEYIKRVETEVPVLRERLRFYDDQVVKSTKKVEELSGTISEQGQALKELLQRSRAAEQQGYNRALQEKQAEMRLAVQSADTAAYARAEQEARAIYQQAQNAAKPAAPVQPQQPAAPQVAPEVAAWVERNQWFNRDKVLNVAAIEAHEAVTREMPGASESERLAETERRIKQEFPHKFGANPRRDAPSSVGTPSGERSNPKKGKSVSDLPPDAQHELQRFKKLIPGFTDKEFLESYEW